MTVVTLEQAERANRLAKQAIEAALEVQRVAGTGLLESAYEAGLVHELAIRKIAFRRQVPVPFKYKGTRLGTGFRADLILDETLIVELKVSKQFMFLDERQMLTYLRLSDCALGLLLNFGRRLAGGGIRRVIDPLTWPAEVASDR